MPVLEKAKLSVLRAGSSRQSPQVEPNTEQEVQFNPATLKLTLKNVHDRGENRGRQVRQYIGADSESYTLELQFDSADQARNGQPVSVREKTWIVERYLRPRSRGVQPPRLRFTWGDFSIDGVVDQLELEFDHFAATGVPLRAKATLTLKKQDSALEVLPEEPRQTGQTRSQPGQPSQAAPGGGGGGRNRNKGQVAPAQGGETPAEFASRQGLDPAAWRGLTMDLEAGAGAGLALAAGTEVGFSAGVGISAGLGVHVGFETGVSASVEASFGLAIEASASVAAGATVGFGASVSASIGAGFWLAAAGGVEAAIELSAGFDASVAVAGSVAAFGGRSTSTRVLTSGPSRPAQARTPLAHAALRPGAHQELPPAPPSPRVDPRAASYGRGLPLRRRVETRSTRPLERDAARTPPISSMPTTPPWDALPRANHVSRSADAQQEALRPQRSCACSCEPSSSAPWTIEREEDPT